MNAEQEFDCWGLVAAAQAGDRDAFGQLYARYQPAVAGFLGARLANRCDAEDLTSETFCKALSRIDSVSDQGNGRDLGPWLTTIARNLLFDRAKSARVRLDAPTDQVPEPRGAQEWDAASSAEQQALARLDRRAAKQTVERGLAGLIPAHRLAVESRLRGDSIAQTAQAVGRPAGAAKELRTRASRALAQQIHRADTARHVAAALEQARIAVARASTPTPAAAQPAHPPVIEPIEQTDVRSTAMEVA